MEEFSNQKIHKKNFKYRGTTSEFYNKFKEYFFLAFPKSLTTSLFSRSPIFFTAVTLLKELQKIAICFTKPVRKKNP